MTVRCDLAWSVGVGTQLTWRHSWASLIFTLTRDIWSYLPHHTGSLPLGMATSAAVLHVEDQLWPLQFDLTTSHNNPYRSNSATMRGALSITRRTTIRQTRHSRRSDKTAQLSMPHLRPFIAIVSSGHASVSGWAWRQGAVLLLVHASPLLCACITGGRRGTMRHHAARRERPLRLRRASVLGAHAASARRLQEI